MASVTVPPMQKPMIPWREAGCPRRSSSARAASTSMVTVSLLSFVITGPSFS